MQHFVNFESFSSVPKSLTELENVIEYAVLIHVPVSAAKV